MNSKNYLRVGAAYLSILKLVCCLHINIQILFFFFELTTFESMKISGSRNLNRRLGFWSYAKIIQNHSSRPSFWNLMHPMFSNYRKNVRQISSKCKIWTFAQAKCRQKIYENNFSIIQMKNENLICMYEPIINILLYPSYRFCLLILAEEQNSWTHYIRKCFVYVCVSALMYECMHMFECISVSNVCLFVVVFLFIIQPFLSKNGSHIAHVRSTKKRNKQKRTTEREIAEKNDRRKMKENKNIGRHLLHFWAADICLNVIDRPYKLYSYRPCIEKKNCSLCEPQTRAMHRIHFCLWFILILFWFWFWFYSVVKYKEIKNICVFFFPASCIIHRIFFIPFVELKFHTLDFHCVFGVRCIIQLVSASICNSNEMSWGCACVGEWMCVLNFFGRMWFQQFFF